MPDASQESRKEGKIYLGLRDSCVERRCFPSSRQQCPPRRCAASLWPIKFQDSYTDTGRASKKGQDETNAVQPRQAAVAMNCTPGQ